MCLRKRGRYPVIAAQAELAGHGGHHPGQTPLLGHPDAIAVASGTVPVGAGGQFKSLATSNWYHAPHRPRLAPKPIRAGEGGRPNPRRLPAYTARRPTRETLATFRFFRMSKFGQKARPRQVERGGAGDHNRPRRIARGGGQVQLEEDVDVVVVPKLPVVPTAASRGGGRGRKSCHLLRW